MRAESLNKWLWITLGVAMLAVAILSRRPPCIDSRVVERIDRIADESTESLWRCQLDRDTAWSSYFQEHRRSIESRLGAIEDALWRLSPFKSRVRIAIVKERPELFAIQGRTIYIGEKVLSENGTLERGLIKAWIRDQVGTSTSDLAEEVVADFLQKALHVPASDGEATERFDQKWPQAIKDAIAYCGSNARFLEHRELCERRPDLLEAQAPHASLRPLLSQAMFRSWTDLTLERKISILRDSSWINALLKDVALPATGQGFPATAQTVQSFNESLARVGSGGSASQLGFSAGFLRHLQGAGFGSAETPVSLDILVVSDFPVDQKSKSFQEVLKYSEAHPEMKIGFKDPKTLWLLPESGTLDPKWVSDLKAQRMAILRCGRFDFDWVLSFDGKADKLFVIDSCGSTEPDLLSWIREGPEGFAAANRGARFIQFHLPSLQSRKAVLNGKADVLSVISKRDVSDPLFQRLGWSELRWMKSVDAYQPQAEVDAIEWFRLN